MKIRVVLADDHRLFAQGLRLVLGGMPEIEVLGEGWDGVAAFQLIQATAPDVALLDIGLPKLDGFEVSRRIKREKLPTRILFLSAFTGEKHIRAALKSGADGYVAKDVVAEDLERAIRAVAAGGRFFPEGYSCKEPDEPVDALPPRQRELLKLISDGKTMKEIALVLGISLKTVESHRAKLMERLGIYDVAGLVRFAIRNGVVES